MGADGRAYVSFGKLLTRQRRFGEAEQLYQDGCRMTENINPHIWQVGARRLLWASSCRRDLAAGSSKRMALCAAAVTLCMWA